MCAAGKDSTTACYSAQCCSPTKESLTTRMSKHKLSTYEMMNSIMKSMELNRREDKLTSVHMRWLLQQNLFQSLHVHGTLQAAGPFSLQGVSTVCQLYIPENKIRKRHIAYCICQPVWALAWDIQLTVTVKSQND